MAEVKLPYNFVPAPTESEVYKPKWANQVSHDIPFSDGESGEITLKITAETPIFIRNGHAKDTEENEFSHIGQGANKRYFIPATSIKGMLRNVLEIMSFSRMKQVDNDRYAFRDLTSGSEYMRSYKSSDVQAGWLFEDFEGNWIIEECENFALISHTELAKEPLKLPFRNLFLGTNPSDKSSKFKYSNIDSKHLHQKFSVVSNQYDRLIASFNNDGIDGTIVFTGQSSRRNENGARPSGKINEFVFFNAQNAKTYNLTSQQKKDFKFIYFDHDSQNISIDWKFWKLKLEKGSKIPIFFTPQSNSIKHFGLAYMYKLPFKYSIHELEPIKNYKDEIKTIMNLPDLIFGYTNDSNSLKGRVFISNAIATSATVLPERREILGSPKASFFPFYLQQPKKNGTHYSYQDSDATLSGYKRYPLQNPNNNQAFEERYTAEQRNNPNVFTNFKPLAEGTEFILKIRFHNLKKAEIGALLSALTFHGNEKSVFHNIGMAKPLGYGKIKISDLQLKGLQNEFLEYLASFEELIGYEKINSERIKILFAMASSGETLRHPILTTRTNQFKTIKEDKDILAKYPTQHIQVKSARQLLENKKKIASSSGENPFSSCKNFKELRNMVKTLLNDEADGYQEFIIETIKRVFDEKETRKTFKDKPFDANPWQLPISIWLGQDKAKALHTKLATKP